MTRIMVEVEAHCAHRVAAIDRCAKVHGHTYRIRAELVGEPDANGVVVDFGVVKDAIEALGFDHADLNDRLDTDNATAEVMAEQTYDALREQEWGHMVRRVEIWETSKYGAAYPA